MKHHDDEATRLKKVKERIDIRAERAVLRELRWDRQRTILEEGLWRYAERRRFWRTVA